jgi:hypothetical protein
MQTLVDYLIYVFSKTFQLVSFTTPVRKMSEKLFYELF